MRRRPCRCGDRLTAVKSTWERLMSIGEHQHLAGNLHRLQRRLLPSLNNKQKSRLSSRPNTQARSFQRFDIGDFVLMASSFLAIRLRRALMIHDGSDQLFASDFARQARSSLSSVPAQQPHRDTRQPGFVALHANFLPPLRVAARARHSPGTVFTFEITQ